MRRRAQARLVEVALAGIVAVFLLVIASRVTRPYLVPPLAETFGEEASSVLQVLSRKGVLCSTVYGKDGRVNGQALREAIEGMLPPKLGYRVLVLRAEDLREIFVYESEGFNAARASASFIILSGCNGFFEPRIVTLVISGD